MDDPAMRPNARPALLLVAEYTDPSRSSFAGRTALLPPETPWPVHEGEPMLLLMQIDLAEARAASPELASSAPEGGLLQAFLSPDLPWDEGPIESVPGVTLLLHPADAALEPRSGDGVPETPMAMRFEPVRTLAGIDLPIDEEGYAELSQQSHQLLGHPFEIQNDPLEDLPEGVGLILQVASDDELGWMFGDVGILYFMADLAAFSQGRLERVHYAFQCS